LSFLLCVLIETPAADKRRAQERDERASLACSGRERFSKDKPDSSLQERHKSSETAIDEHGDENAPIVGAVIDNEVFTEQVRSSEYAADACGKYAF
jgi:hypothetical protein